MINYIKSYSKIEDYLDHKDIVRLLLFLLKFRREHGTRNRNIKLIEQWLLDENSVSKADFRGMYFTYTNNVVLGKNYSDINMAIKSSYNDARIAIRDCIKEIVKTFMAKTTFKSKEWNNFIND